MQMPRRILGAVAAALALLPVSAAAVPVAWVDWQTVSDDRTTVTGVLNVDGVEVGVTYTHSNVFSFVQTGRPGETDFFQNGRSGRDAASSAYTSVGEDGVDNVPTGTDIVANRFAGSGTITFDQAIEGLYFAFVSTNRNVYTFDQDFTILSLAGEDLDGAGVDDSGFWGAGLATRLDNGDGTFSLVTEGAEPHGVFQFAASLSSIAFEIAANENWNGFTIGVAGLADTSPDPDPDVVPLPGAALLFVTGAAVLGARRRARLR